MSCPVCPLKMTYAVVPLLNKACGSCQRHIKQMMAGFNGVVTESRPLKNTWDNSAAYREWMGQLKDCDSEPVNLKKKDSEVIQRCDIRDMRRIVGLPTFLPLEQQVFNGWIVDREKDEKLQELMGLTYSQLVHVKKIVKLRLQKQMAYYHTIKKLEKEGHNG